ncbi:hypothetical protein [Parasphingorhabdus sp.]
MFALLIGALSPAGFMPMQTAQGFAIVLCSGYEMNMSSESPDHAEHDAAMDHSAHHGDQDQSEMESNICAYAGGAGVGLDSSPLPTNGTPLVASSPKPGEPRQYAVRNRVNIPPATGPPAII